MWRTFKSCKKMARKWPKMVKKCRNAPEQPKMVMYPHLWPFFLRPGVHPPCLPTSPPCQRRWLFSDHPQSEMNIGGCWTRGGEAVLSPGVRAYCVCQPLIFKGTVLQLPLPGEGISGSMGGPTRTCHPRGGGLGRSGQIGNPNRGGWT